MKNDWYGFVKFKDGRNEYIVAYNKDDNFLEVTIRGNERYIYTTENIRLPNGIICKEHIFYRVIPKDDFYANMSFSFTNENNIDFTDLVDIRRTDDISYIHLVEKD